MYSNQWLHSETKAMKRLQIIKHLNFEWPLINILEGKAPSVS